MKFFTFIIIFIQANNVLAYLKIDPLQFQLSTEKESYYEGEKITFILTITNISNKNAPIYIPHTQNTGLKIYSLKIFDYAENVYIERYKEDLNVKMMVKDTGKVKIVWLKPNESYKLYMYWNDFENYYSYHTQIASHHSFGVPLFVGKYKVNVVYNPMNIKGADTLYKFITGFKFNEYEIDYLDDRTDLYYGDNISTSCLLKIKKSKDTLIKIEGATYLTKKYRGWTWYYHESSVKNAYPDKLVHISSIEVDSFEHYNPAKEYYYSQYFNQYNEYILRHEDGNILTYRKFKNNCPTELLSYVYNINKKLVTYSCKLNDGRFYTIKYNQQSGLIDYEIYYSADATLATITTYKYNKKWKLIDKDEKTFVPCIMDEL